MTFGLQIGSTLAGYRIEALVGRGGMGACTAPRSSGSTARSHSSSSPPTSSQDQGFRERFERESRTTASIDHPK